MNQNNTFTPAYNAMPKQQIAIQKIVDGINNQLSYELHISHPTGKMDGINCISTYMALNPYCMARVNKYKDDITTACSNCFSATSYPLKMLKVLTPYVKNSMVLSKDIIPVEYLPVIYDLVFRFESHGDLINVIHAINYCNICRKNPWCKFTIWTKNPNLLKTAFNQTGGKPENLTVIFSSLRLNEIDTSVLNKYDFIDKVFTVYNSEYAINNNICINCGTKKCNQCQNCYLKAKESPVFINEILKDEATKFINAGGVIQ